MTLPPSLKRHSPRRAGPQRERGVALVTVLAIVLLMTVLVMSFFTMARSELKASTKDAENLKARALADAAVNIAISQIREATTQRATDGTIRPWSSQPGAIRVYQPYGDLQKIFKLYSSDEMEASSLQDLEKRDRKGDWDTEPDQWVDLNKVVMVPNPTSPTDVDQAEMFFPIVDPRAMRGRGVDSVEGFSYEARDMNGVVRPSGRPNSQRLPMPVRWLYLLADGTIGHLNKGGEFVAPVGGSEASKENPIVGRVGFWTDDETCKINVNTASEGVYWDTPRSSSDEDKALGASQPMNGEFQRYPGHPAMVCLSSVLFPNKRFKADQSLSAPPVGGSTAMQDMEISEVQSIWRSSPYIYGERDNSPTKSSSFGGRQKPAGLAQTLTGNPSKVAALPGEPFPKHLYNSYDDYVIAATSDAKIGGKAGDADIRERQPVGTDKAVTLPVDRIQQGRFFLTTRSSAPEITLKGTPKMALWPMHVDLANELANDKSSVIAAGSKYTVFDTLIGFNSSLRRERRVYPYFYQRESADYRHGEFYGSGGGRNLVLFRYISNSMIERVPGFGLRRSDASGQNFASFEEKYGGGNQDDVNAIAGQMIDYIRNQNLYDGNLPEANRYSLNDAYGQITPICLCGGTSAHANTWFVATNALPKGAGRFLTVSEVALIVCLRAKQTGSQTFPVPVNFETNNQRIVGNPPAPGSDFYEFDVGLLIEGFVPSQGWGEYHPKASFTLGGYSGRGKPSVTKTFVEEGVSVSGVAIADKLEISGRHLYFPPGAITSTVDCAGMGLPKDWIGWGGTLGCRFVTHAIAFKPILFKVPAGQRPPPFSFSGTSGSGNHLRLIVYDINGAPNANNEVDVNNLIQFIPLCFPEIKRPFPLPADDINPCPLRAGFTGGNALDRMTESRQNGIVFGEDGLIHPGDIVQSLVPNHGDFRLIAAKRAVMQGRARSGENEGARSFPIFVGHPLYGKVAQAHSLTEPEPGLNKALNTHRPRIPLMGGSKDFGYFTSGTEPGIPNMKQFEREYLPDFPIKPWETRTTVPLVRGLSTANLGQGASAGGRDAEMAMDEVFNSGRYDRISATNFKRGPARPDLTGDFDTGVGPAVDGPYINRGDDGEVRGAETAGGAPYFSKIIADQNARKIPKVNAAMFAPNRTIPSSGVFGSLSTGIQANVPWQTLLLRPDPELFKNNPDPKKQHYGSRWPHDHLFMDFFWMPVVQPYAISEPFETKGKINLNYQILPFTYITRATALHALFKSEKIMAVPDDRVDDYKVAERTGDTYKSADKEGGAAVFRHFIDANETLKQWDDRFQGRDKVSTTMGIKPGAFLSPTEICDQWLIPQGATRETIVRFWQTHRQTGDNVKERPYANLYPRLTTRSNSYRVHVIAQSLKKNRKNDQKTFDLLKGDQVTAEYRGSYGVERSIDPTDPDIPDYATLIANDPKADYEPLDKFYFYRISQVKQFVR